MYPRTFKSAHLANEPHVHALHTVVSFQRIPPWSCITVPGRSTIKMYISIGHYIYEVAIDEEKNTIQELVTKLRGDRLYFFSFIPSTDIIHDIFEWLQVHFMSPKFMLIGDMYAFVQKFHSTTPWACPIYARPLRKCATFCPCTQDAMDKISRWCQWQCSWAFLHKSVTRSIYQVLNVSNCK